MKTTVPTLTIHSVDRESDANLDADLFHQWVLPDGSLWTAFYRTADGFLLRFPGLADFTVTRDGKSVAAYPTGGALKPTIEHLYLNQVLPLALSRQYRLVFHSSAVEIESFAVAFLGESGRGKSTLAASFCTRGYRFLTDDGLKLKKGPAGYSIEPSHPSIRLWTDSRDALVTADAKTAPALDYTPKLRILAGGEVAYCDSPRPLRCLYLLGEGKTEEVSIEPVKPRDAMIELVRHSFLLDIEEREMLTYHFTQLTDMARSLLFFHLDYPRNFEVLPVVRDRVARHSISLSQS